MATITSPSFWTVMVLLCVLYMGSCLCKPHGVSKTPVSTTNPPFRHRNHPEQPGGIWGTMKRPYPTHSFWMNAVLDDSKWQFSPLPYMTRIESKGITVCYPEYFAAGTHVASIFIADVTITATQAEGKRIADYDELGVQVEWYKNVLLPKGHGLAMFLGWGVFVMLSLITAKYPASLDANWRYITSFVCVTINLILSIVAITLTSLFKGDMQISTNNTFHKILGYPLFIMSFVFPISNAAIMILKHFYEKNPWIIRCETVYWILLLIAPLAGVVEIADGMRMMGVNAGIWPVYAFFFMYLLWILFYAKLWLIPFTLTGQHETAQRLKHKSMAIVGQKENIESTSEYSKLSGSQDVNAAFLKTNCCVVIVAVVGVAVIICFIAVLWFTYPNELTMRAYIVRGSPYITLEYSGLSPQISSVHAIVRINEQNQPSDIQSNALEIEFNDGKTWKLYTTKGKSPLFSWDNIDGLSTKKRLHGTMQLAMIPELPNGRDIIDAHTNAYATGGKITYAVNRGDNTAAVTFEWKTKGKKNNLLMMALPHHISLLENPVSFSRTYKTIKGNMTGIVGSTWTLKYALPQVTWDAPRAIDPARIGDIKAALQADQDWPIEPAIDVYAYGKTLSASARLALIAEQLGNIVIRNKLVQKLKTAIEPWLKGTNTNNFNYDESWGGVCTSRGLDDRRADFGNGYYNDHHFHYGYYIYSAAVIARFDMAWASQNAVFVNALIRDIANPSTEDEFFPITRHKNWFLGHSWANGLDAFPDSKNQESTSEAVHAYYGIYLWGLATSNGHIEDLGHVLMASEIQSVQTYWHIKPNSDIYPPEFANPIVGILWSTKADNATWFGANMEYIHCIQMLPFTPITEWLLSPVSWVSYEYSFLSRVLSGDIADIWKGYVLMDSAILDKTKAWNDVQNLTQYDNGNPKTNALYWIATRP